MKYDHNISRVNWNSFMYIKLLSRLMHQNFVCLYGIFFSSNSISFKNAFKIQLNCKYPRCVMLNVCISAFPVLQHGWRIYENLQLDMHDASNRTLERLPAVPRAHAPGVSPELMGRHQ